MQQFAIVRTIINDATPISDVRLTAMHANLVVNRQYKPNEYHNDNYKYTLYAIHLKAINDMIS